MNQIPKPWTVDASAGYYPYEQPCMSFLVRGGIDNVYCTSLGISIAVDLTFRQSLPINMLLHLNFLIQVYTTPLT